MAAVEYYVTDVLEDMLLKNLKINVANVHTSSWVNSYLDDYIHGKETWSIMQIHKSFLLPQSFNEIL